SCGSIGRRAMLAGWPTISRSRAVPHPAMNALLVNFATRRCVGDTAGLLIEVAGKPKLWLGDNRVFRWHRDWHLTHGSIVHSVLMALEQWFYEQIDHGRTVEAAVHRIV